jgi:hypothetical protein
LRRRGPCLEPCGDVGLRLRLRLHLLSLLLVDQRLSLRLRLLLVYRSPDLRLGLLK